MFAVGALLHSVKNYEVPFSVLVQAQNGRLVAHPVAVVGSRPQSHQLLVEPVYVSFLHQLMSPHNKVHLVQQVELVDYFCTKNPSCSSRVPSPSLYVLGIRPHQVSQWSFVRNLLLPVQESHLVNGWKVRRKASVDAKSVTVDDSSQRQEVKGLIEVLPAVGISILFVDLI